MKKIVLSIFFIVYILIVVTITISVNKYNSFGVIEVKNKLIATSNKTNMDYSKGTILIISKNSSNLKENEEVFYYTADEHKVLISKGKITNIEEVTESEKTITLSNNKKYSKDYIIGKTSEVTKIPVLGYLLMLLTSKIGYLLLILLPIFAFFFFQVYLLIKRK